MPTFERRHPVSGFYPLLPRTDGGSRCAPNGRPRTRSADVHPAGGRNDVFTMRTALPTSPPPRPVAFFTSKGPLSGRAELPFSERPVQQTEATGDTIPPPESTARVSPAVPSPARPHRSGTSEYEARPFFAARNLSGPSLFPDRAGPASVPSPRTGTGNRPASYLRKNRFSRPFRRSSPHPNGTLVRIFPRSLFRWSRLPPLFVRAFRGRCPASLPQVVKKHGRSTVLRLSSVPLSPDSPHPSIHSGSAWRL